MAYRAGAALLERESELEAISAHLDGALRGEGRLVAVEGAAGIGKTSLIRASIEYARERDMTVLQARGGVLEQSAEYGVARQLVERRLLAESSERRDQLLSGPAAASAAALGFGDLPVDPGPGGDPTAEIQHALHWLFANLADESPVLIAIDDAHWGDRASLQAAGYLARRIEGLPLILLVGTRDDEPNSHWPLLSEIFASADPAYLRPQPLSREAAGELVGGVFAGQQAPGELIDACIRATGGNPFLLTELATELSAGHADPGQLSPEMVDGAGPLAVRRSLLLRLGSLGEEPRRLARAVAMLGGEAESRHAAKVAGLDGEASRRAADLLVAAGILEPNLPLRMIHPLVRAAIAEDTPPSDRAAAHRLAFEVLSSDSATDQTLLPHVMAAEPAEDEAVVELLGRLAERALRTGIPTAAVDYMRRALVEPPPPPRRAEVLAGLGRAEVRSGQFGSGLEHLEQALDLTENRDSRAAMHRDRAFAAFASAGMDEARRVVGEAVADLGRSESDGALRLEADLALMAWLSGGEHGLHLSRHRALSGETEAERTMLALLAQERHARGGSPDEVVELASRALAGGRLIAEDTSEALSWYMATYALLTCEAYALSKATIDEAMADSRRRGSAFARAGALGTRAVLALGEGRPRDAEADAREAAAAPMPPIMAPVNAAYLVMALTDQGDLATAEAELLAAGIDQGPGGPTVLRWVPWARARLREAQGQTDDVRLAIAPLAEDDRAGRPMRSLAWRALLSRTLSRQVEVPDEAHSLADEHLRWAESWGRPGALGVAQRAMALTESGGARIDRLRRAVATLAESALRTEDALARLDLGIALLRSGQRREGVSVVEKALTLAVDVGARGTAQAAAAELEIAGAPRRRLAFDELTASERRIAELAAAGRTNREIAEELFVTPKTVENHLTRVYSKLSIGSRRELSNAL